MEFLEKDVTVVYRSPQPARVYAYSPYITVLKSGRYVYTNDIGGPGLKDLDEWKQSGSTAMFGQIFTSDDKGKTWQYKCARNFIFGRTIEGEGALYLIGVIHNEGRCEDLIVFKSSDDGDTWDMGTLLTKGESWHQAPCSVWIEDGYVTLVMERCFNFAGEVTSGWNVSSLAPVVMRAKLDKDLTKKENWIFSNEVRFRDVINDDDLDMHGIPFFHTMAHRNELPKGTDLTEIPGWLESNIVKIKDETHYWYDENGKTFHIFMRAHTAGTGYCCVMKAVITEEDGKEKITVMPQTSPSGRKVVYLPMPGGQMRFHVVYDEKTKLYWLLSTQATDSMRRKECLSKERFNIPCDERDRLQLSFSKNMVDWCFAGLVAKGDSEKQSRHYAGLTIDGDDLLVACRSGDKDTSSAHDTNLSTFHRIKNFRDLVY